MEQREDSRVGALERFAYWTRSGGIRRPWALEALLRTLALTGGEIGASHIVLEWLATISVDDPLGSVIALQALLGGRRAHFLSSEEPVRAILRAAIQTRGDAFEVAKQIGTNFTNNGVRQFVPLFDLSAERTVATGGESPTV